MITDKKLHSTVADVLPKGWFTGPPTVEMDDDEVLVIGPLPEAVGVGEFRESTRDERMQIASDLEARTGRKVAWGVQHDGMTTVFTSLNLPVMTRLRLRERKVLDTLVEGGVARSRSEALAWCVKLVGDNEGVWIEQLRGALGTVREARSAGPKAGRHN